jgi:hypothetical protein
MRYLLPLLLAAGLSVSSTAQAATITFNTAPFAGTTALETNGRQIVGGEPSIAFNPAVDVFAFDSSIFDFGGSIGFFNGLVGSLPASGIEAIVLGTFDDDANAGTPFGAGNAANLIAAQVTSDGAGVFIYFNSGLDLARLVYSTNLNENTADLKILARMTNLSGPAGREALASFTAANFQVVATPVPEPATLTLLASVGGLFIARRLVRRRAR